MRIQRLSTGLTIVAIGATAWSGVALAAPTVTPGVKRTFVGADPGSGCRYGYLCAYVWGGRGYYRFDFTRCNTRYRVSGWHGRGYLTNSQFGGVTAFFYRRSDQIYTTRTARGTSSINWEPVWSLRVC